MSSHLRIVFLSISCVFAVCAYGAGQDSIAIVQPKPESDMKEMEVSIDTEADKVLAKTDSPAVHERIRPYWVNLLRGKRLEVRDTTVKYPKFINFCLNVYRWAEDTFNTYDPEYVSGTGKHGKVRLVSDNWANVHYFHVPGSIPLQMASVPCSNFGVAANYSILSASFTADMRSIIKGQKVKYKKMQFGFTCARLLAELYYWENTGTNRITFIGKESLLGEKGISYTGLKFTSLGITGLYIFDYKKFSLAAAYNLSNYQLKSAGTWILGAAYTRYNSNYDFSQLPEEVKEKAELPVEKYVIDYDCVNVVGGYSYNWVLNRHWMINGTILPGAGLSFMTRDSSTGKRTLLSTSARTQASINYMTHQFFVVMSGTYNANFILTKNVTSMAGIGYLQISTGIRF